MEGITIREPVPADGVGIGRVHARAWRRAYAGMVPQRFLAQLDEVTCGRAWYRRLNARSAGLLLEANEVLVAERRGLRGGHREVVGVATIGADRDDPTCQRGEVWMINVLPEVWGTGVGDALLSAAEERLADQGYDSAVLWVITGNTRARRFYERHGWVADGAAKVSELGGTTVAECRYRRRLAGPAFFGA